MQLDSEAVREIIVRLVLVGGTQLHASVRLDDDRQRVVVVVVPPVVPDLDDATAANPLESSLQTLAPHDRRHVRAGRERVLSLVFPAAQGHAERTVVGHPNVDRMHVWRKGNPAENGIDRDPGNRQMRPSGAVIGQIAHLNIADRRLVIVRFDEQAQLRTEIPGQIAIEDPAADRLGNIQRARQMRDFAFALRTREQLHILAEGAEEEAVVVDSTRRRPGHRERVQAPQVQPDVRDVAAPLLRLGAAHVDRAGQRVEGGVAPFQRLPVAQVRRHGVPRPDVVHVLAALEQLKGLHHPGVPAGDIARQLLQHRRGALPPAKGDRVGDLRAALLVRADTP